MASVGESDCHKDPNFAVICSCLDKYGESLGLPPVTYLELKQYLEDTSIEGCRVLIDIHVRLLRRIGKSSVSSDRFEKSIIKFCHHFSEFDAWEVESYGYRHAQMSTKLRILKNLLECQFDFNVKFKEKVNESSAEDMRFLPIGRDKEGQAYWYFVDKDNNLMVYKEEQDDEDADTWQLICSDRQELAQLVETLQKDTKTEVKEEDDKSSTTVSRSSKEGTPDKELPKSADPGPCKEECKANDENKPSEKLLKEVDEIKQETVEEVKEEVANNEKNVDDRDRNEKNNALPESNKKEPDIKTDGSDFKVYEQSSERDASAEDAEAKSSEEKAEPLACESTTTQEKSTKYSKQKEPVSELGSDQVPGSTGAPQSPAHSDQTSEKPKSVPETQSAKSKELPRAAEQHEDQQTDQEMVPYKKSQNLENKCAEIVDGEENKVSEEVSSLKDKSMTQTLAQSPPESEKKEDTKVMQKEDISESQEGNVKTPQTEENTQEKRGEENASEPKNTALQISDCGSPLEKQVSESKNSQLKNVHIKSMDSADFEKDKTALAPEQNIEENIDETSPEGKQDTKEMDKCKSQVEDSSDKEKVHINAPNIDKLADEARLADSESSKSVEQDENVQKDISKDKDIDTTELIDAKEQSPLDISQRETQVDSKLNDNRSEKQLENELSMETNGLNLPLENSSRDICEMPSEKKEEDIKNTKESKEATTSTTSLKIQRNAHKSMEILAVPTNEQDELTSQNAQHVAKESIAGHPSSDSCLALCVSEEKEQKSAPKGGEACSEHDASKNNSQKGVKDLTPEPRSTSPFTKHPPDKGRERAPEGNDDSATCSEDCISVSAAGESITKESQPKDGGNEMEGAIGDAHEEVKQRNPTVEDVKPSEQTDEDDKQPKQANEALKQPKQADEDATDDVKQAKQTNEDIKQLKEAKKSDKDIEQSKQTDENVGEDKQPRQADEDVKQPTPTDEDVKQPKQGDEDVKKTKQMDEDVKKPKQTDENFKQSKQDDIQQPKQTDEDVKKPKQTDENIKQSKQEDDIQQPKQTGEDFKKPKQTDENIKQSKQEDDVQQPKQTDEDVKKPKQTDENIKQSKQEDDVQQPKQANEDVKKPKQTDENIKQSKQEDDVQQPKQADEDVKKPKQTDEDIEQPKQEDAVQQHKHADEAVKQSKEPGEDIKQPKPAGDSPSLENQEKRKLMSPEVKENDSHHQTDHKEVDVQSTASRVACNGLEQDAGDADNLLELKCDRVKPVTDDQSCEVNVSRKGFDKSSVTEKKSGGSKDLSVPETSPNGELNANGSKDTKTDKETKNEDSLTQKESFADAAGSSKSATNVQANKPRTETEDKAAVKNKPDINTEDKPKQMIKDPESKAHEDSNASEADSKEISEKEEKRLESDGEKESDKKANEQQTRDKPLTVKAPVVSKRLKDTANEKHDANNKDAEDRCSKKSRKMTSEDKDDCPEDMQKNYTCSEDLSVETQKDPEKLESTNGSVKPNINNKDPEQDVMKKAPEEDKAKDSSISASKEVPETLAKEECEKGKEKEERIKTKEGDDKSSQEKKYDSKSKRDGENDLPKEGDLHTSENISKLPEEKEDGKPAVAETPPSRKLKRAAPDAGSDEPQDMTQPNGKRARQTARVQRTRGGRNAAARGRAARQVAGTGSESEESEAASSRGRGGRGRRGRNFRGRGRKVARGGKSRSEDAAAEANPVAGEEDAAQEKRAKKKKPDSSSEALSGEEVTPAKKGRNQAQTMPKTPRGGRGGKRGGRGRGRGNSRAAAVSSSNTEETNLRRSSRVKQARARRPPTSPSEESSEDTEEETEEEEEEGDKEKDFLDVSFTPEEESGDEDFKPKGRNFQRQEARTIKEQNEECVNDDTPCLKCGKYNHPEMILLCDKCDAGYHTACLRPPLMLIPDGDWFCPPCEHSFLVTRLLECLQALDLANKKKDRLSKRQERLAYVGINIGNILQAGERQITPSEKFSQKEEEGGIDENTDPSKRKARRKSKDEGSYEDEEEEEEDDETEEEEASIGGSSYSSEESEPEVPERKYRSRRLALRQAQRSSRRREKQRHKRRKAGRRSGGGTSPEVEIYAKRTCRTRSNISYQFKEFDELISNAIEDDKPCPREKKPGRSTGKDMSNILGASDDEDEQIRQRDGDSSGGGGGPPRVVKRKSKRKLTKLDSDESDQEDDESEEFKLSEEDSEATEIEGDEEEEEDELNSEDSDSGAWKPKKTWYNSRSVRRPKKSRFVVEDDEYDSDENASKRRSTRNSNRGRILYNDWGSEDETEEEEASFSEYSSEESVKARKASSKKPTAPVKKKAKGKADKGSEGSRSDSSVTRKRKILRKLVKKRRKDVSDSEETDGEVKEKGGKKKGSRSDSEFTVEEGESTSNSEESPKFKKKNVIRSSDEEEEPGEKEKEATKVEKMQDESNVETGKGVKASSGPNKKNAVKGKKRVEVPASEEAASSVEAEAGVPDKVRRVSGSDKESPAALTPAPQAEPAGKRRQPARRQRGKSSDGQAEAPFGEQEVQSSPVKNEAGKRGGKKKKVPNFLGVPEGGEDEINSNITGQQVKSEQAAAPSASAVSQPDIKDQTALANIRGDGATQAVHHPPYSQHSGAGHPSQFQGQMGFDPQAQPPNAHTGQAQHLRHPPPFAVSQSQMGGPGQLFNNPAVMSSHGVRPGMASPPHYTSSGPRQPQQQMMGSYPQMQPHQGYPRAMRPGLEPGQILPQGHHLQPQQAHSNHHVQQQQQRMLAPQPGLGQSMRPATSVVGSSTPPHSSSQHFSGPTMPPPDMMQQQNPRLPSQHPAYSTGGPQQHQQSSHSQGPPQGSSDGSSPSYLQQQQYQHAPPNFRGPGGRMPTPRDIGPGYYGMRPPPSQGGMAGQHFQPYGAPPSSMMAQGFQGMNSPLTRMGQMTRNLGPTNVQGMNAGVVEPGPTPEKRPSLGSPQHSEGLAEHEKDAEGPKHPKLETSAEQRETKSPEKPASKKRGPRGKRGTKQESANAASISSQGLLSKQLQGMPGVTHGQGLPPNQGISQGLPPRGMLQNLPPNQGPTSTQGVPQGPPMNQSMQGPPPRQLPPGSTSTQGMPQGPPTNPVMSHGPLPDQDIKQGPMQSQGMPSGPTPSQGVRQGLPPNQGISQGPPHPGIPQGAPNQGMLQGPPHQGIAQGAPNQGMPQGLPHQGIPQGPQHRMPQDSPHQGVPQSHGMMPAQRMPQGPYHGQHGGPYNQMPYGMAQYQHPPYMHPQYMQHHSQNPNLMPPRQQMPAGNQHQPYLPPPNGQESMANQAAPMPQQDTDQGSMQQQGGKTSPVKKEENAPSTQKQAEPESSKAAPGNDSKPQTSTTSTSNSEQGQQPPVQMSSSEKSAAMVSSGQQPPPNSTPMTPTSAPQGQMTPPYTSHGNMAMSTQPGMFYNAGPYNNYQYGQPMPPPRPHGMWNPQGMPVYSGPGHRFGPGMYPYNMGGSEPHHHQHPQAPRMLPTSTPPPHQASPGATPPHGAAPRSSRTPSTDSQHNSEPEAQPSSQNQIDGGKPQNQPASSSPSQVATAKYQAPPPSSSPSQPKQEPPSSPARLVTGTVDREPVTATTTTTTDNISSSPMSAGNLGPQLPNNAPSSLSAAAPAPALSSNSAPQHGMPPHSMHQYPPHPHYQQPGMAPWVGMMQPPYSGHNPIGAQHHPHYQGQQPPVMHPGFHPGYDQNRFRGNGMGSVPPGYGQQQYMAGLPQPSEPGAPLTQPHRESPPPTNQNNSSKDIKTEGNAAAPKPKKAKTQKKASGVGKDGAPAPGRGKGTGGGSKGRGRGGRGGFMIDNLLHTRKDGEEEEDGENSGDINDIASYVATDEYFKQQTSS